MSTWKAICGRQARAWAGVGGVPRRRLEKVRVLQQRHRVRKTHAEVRARSAALGAASDGGQDWYFTMELSGSILKPQALTCGAARKRPVVMPDLQLRFTGPPPKDGQLVVNGTCD